MIYTSPRRQNKYLKRFKPFFVFFILIALVSYIGVRFVVNIKPMVQSLAISQAKAVATRAIYNSVNKELSELGTDYSDLITLEKDSEQNIVAIRTNSVKMNQLKAKLSVIVLSEIEKEDNARITIPIGSILGGAILSGRGPKMTFDLIPTGMVTGDFKNVFEDAGINQTRHQIVMEITVKIGVVLTGYSTFTEVTAQIPVAETIIVGKIPTDYVNIEKTDDDLETVNNYKKD